MRYKILFKDKVDPKILKEIQSKHGMDIDGINDLYDLLIKDGTCDSYEAAKIYYVAYTLALESIELILVQVK